MMTAKIPDRTSSWRQTCHQQSWSSMLSQLDSFFWYLEDVLSLIWKAPSVLKERISLHPNLSLTFKTTTALDDWEPSQKRGKHNFRACFWCTTSYRWLKCRYHVHHLAPQNTSWENTWRPLHGCPGDTFRLKTLIQRAVWHLAVPFAEGRSSYFHFGFISITLMKIWCTGREQESHLGIEVRNRLKIYGVCKMKSVVEGLLFYCLGQVCTRAKRWQAWMPLQDCFHSWLWRCLWWLDWT